MDDLIRVTKLIKVKDETHKELMKLGKYGDTMDGIINEILDYYKKSRYGAGSRVSS
jgi:hypothetical protein